MINRKTGGLIQNLKVFISLADKILSKKIKFCGTIRKKYGKSTNYNQIIYNENCISLTTLY